MGRWAHLDSDEERLPEGMRRVAYDADTQTYTYEDSQGVKWEGVPGARYGRLRRVDQNPNRAPPLPVFESDDKEIMGDEPVYVLHDSDDDDEKKGNNKTFDEILKENPPTTEPQKAYMKRWNSLSRAATKYIPKLPPLPGGGHGVESGVGVQKVGITTDNPLASSLRRRASTMSAITREVAGGVKQMFAEESEYRAHRAR
ncbi:hypothetical protein B0T14DRAFT_500537 [Immersiella caudata]|uniref:Uncharacterized protein n=1 Tax=Immersiella caudata TaxID=314043 RepID=A0AA39W4E7_9PEZI|nr:hypothetical protein B0T14DRAFT_500537 [Immersiella caudata]